MQSRISLGDIQHPPRGLESGKAARVPETLIHLVHADYDFQKFRSLERSGKSNTILQLELVEGWCYSRPGPGR